MNDRKGSEERLLGALADDRPGPEHMADMMSGVRERARAAEMRRRRAGRSAIAAGVAVVAAAVLLVVPMSYDVEVGDRLVVSWPTALAQSEDIDAALDGIDGVVGRKIGYRDGTAHARMVVIGPPVGEVVAAVREVLADHLPDHATADIARSPIIRRVGGNVLAALTQGSFRVAARGMTDDEIELAIIEELGLIGVRGADAEVTDQPDGSKRIDVRMSDSPYDSLTFEVEL